MQVRNIFCRNLDLSFFCISIHCPVMILSCLEISTWWYRRVTGWMA